MKKICILTSVHPVFDARIFYKEAKTLSSAGYDVSLIAQHNKKETVENIKIIPLPKPKNRFERFLKTDYLLYKKALQQKADVYHFHDPELLPWMIMLKKKMQTKIIYDVHEDVPCQILNKHWLPRIIRGFIAKIVGSTEWLSAKIFDAILPATTKIANRFPTIKTTVIHNFPIITDFSINSIPYFERPLSFVYAGGIAKIRGIMEAIQALSLLNDVPQKKLELAGPFDHKKFFETLKSLPGWTLVNYYGTIPEKQVNLLLGKVRAGLVLHQPVPNEIDALPIKLFQYMAAGLPIIASNFPAWKKIINKANCGLLVDPLDTKAISKAMRWILKNPEEAKIMGQRGRRAIELNYNWENESKKLLEIYEKLLK